MYVFEMINRITVCESEKPLLVMDGTKSSRCKIEVESWQGNGSPDENKHRSNEHKKVSWIT